MQERVQAAVAYLRRISARSTAHRGSLAAGGLAYFVALSVAPAALAIGWLVGRILTPDQVREALTRAASSTPGLLEQAKPAIDAVTSIVGSASSGTVSAASIIGVLIAIYAASRMVFGLRLALNSAFGVPDRYRGILARVASTVTTLIGLMAAVAVILLLTIVPKVLGAFGLADVRLTSGIWVVDWAVAALVVWLACWGVIAKGPNHRRSVPWWSPGPFIAALWIIVVSAGVGVYATLSASISAAVAIFGSALVLLLWLYLGFVGLLFGAEIEADRQGLGGVEEEG